MLVCRVCGESNPAQARFCMTCGSPLPQPAEPSSGEIRKTVTVLFCDVVGSTPLGEQLDPESVRRVMTGFYDGMRAVLERHSGAVEKYIGDAVMGVFGLPVLHEDDALRAVRAAAEMREALSQLNGELRTSFGVELQIRIGVNTGEIVVGDAASGSPVLGDAINVAARLEQTAAPGDILLGQQTYALVRDAVTVDSGRALSLKGKAEPVTGYRLLEVEPRSGRDEHPAPAFVGRAFELAALRDAFDDSASESVCVLLTVLGAAGVGKSRLAEEFAASVAEEARVVRGRCLPYGDGITFWPVAEMVRDACGIGIDEPRDTARQKIASVLQGTDDDGLIVDGVAAVAGLAQTSAGMQETFWAIRRFLDVLQRERPLVVLFDDIHWAEPVFLDLIEYLASWSRDARITLLCLARPELLELRPGWIGMEPAAHAVMLSPLAPEESAALIGSLLGTSPLDASDRDRIVEAAEGNPLFLEEMLRMLEDDGLLSNDGGVWKVVGDLSQVAVPATIQALLAARLDRLGPQERVVLGAASVIGKEFWWGAVSELCPDSLRPFVGSHLQTLVRKGLISPERSTLAGEDAFRFHHILILDASYSGLPKERRAELHERFAAWAEERPGDRMPEYEAVVGYHLEQAFRYRRELGATGSDVDRLGERAADRLAVAGRRALGRGDMAAAVSLLERATDLLPPESLERAQLLPDLSEALMETGALARADELLTEAIRVADGAGDAGLRGHATIVRLLLMESTDPKGRSEVALREIERVIPAFEELGDELGLARAYRLKADVHWTRATYSAAEDAIEHAIEHARRAGAGYEEAENLGLYVGAGVYGPTPVEEVVARCERILGETKGNRLVEAQALRSLAAMRAMEGRFDEARTSVARAAAIMQDLGWSLRAAFTSETAGFVERLAGDPAACERELRGGFALIEKLGEQGFLSTVAALLAHVILDQDRTGEAEEFVAASEAAAAEDDVATHILLQSARARVLARRGMADEADELSRAAVREAEESDDVNSHADVLTHRAEVLRRAGNSEGAGGALTRAVELYDAKGNRAQAEPLRSQLV